MPGQPNKNIKALPKRQPLLVKDIVDNYPSKAKLLEEKGISLWNGKIQTTHWKPENPFVDHNLILIPIADYSHRKNKKSYVECHLGQGVTRVGSMLGALTAFDEKVLKLGILSFTKESYGIMTSTFTMPALARRIGVPWDGFWCNQLHHSLDKIIHLQIDFSAFQPCGKNKKKIQKWVSLIKPNGIITDENRPKKYILLWDDTFGKDMAKKWGLFFKYNEYKKLPTPVSRRLYEILSLVLSTKTDRVRQIKKHELCKRAGINDSNPARRQQRLMRELNIMQAYSQISYYIKGENIYPRYKSIRLIPNKRGEYRRVFY